MKTILTAMVLALAGAALAGCTVADLYAGGAARHDTTARLLAYGRRVDRLDADQRRQAYTRLMPLKGEGCSVERVRLALLLLATPATDVPDGVPADPVAPCVGDAHVADRSAADLAALLQSLLQQRRARINRLQDLEQQNRHMESQLDKIKQLERSMQLRSGPATGSGG